MAVRIHSSESDLCRVHGGFFNRTSAVRQAEYEPVPRGLANAKTNCRKVENRRNPGESAVAERVLDDTGFIMAVASTAAEQISGPMAPKQRVRLS